MRKNLFLAILATLAVSGAATFAQSVRILDDAPLDRAVDFRHDDLLARFRQMSTEGIRTMRLLEGGEYNVNIRHVENVTPETFVTLVHPDTIDVWVVQEGSGTLLTGGEKEGDLQIGGDERFISAGDLIFIPAGVPHGMKETDSITWLNIRFPEHRN